MITKDAMPIIAGHVLRKVLSQRWGLLYHVGRTDRAFKTIEEAIDYAGDNPVTFSMLISEYQTFCLNNDLQLGSADEHLFDENLTDEERLWLVDFCARWESVALHEKAFAA